MLWLLQTQLVHKSGNGCVIYLHRSWLVLAEFFWWCQMFGLYISEFLVCSSCLTVLYILFFSFGMKILLSLFIFHVFVFRFIKTSAVIASAPELDVPTRILYFDKMISTLEELQTGKNNLQTFFLGGGVFLTHLLTSVIVNFL